jgi:hypothetical protein
MAHRVGDFPAILMMVLGLGCTMGILAVFMPETRPAQYKDN